MRLTEHYLFDWGDTLMVDFSDMSGKMCDWEYVEAMPCASVLLEHLSQNASLYIATAAADSTAIDIQRSFERVGLHQYITEYFCKQNTGFMKPAHAFYEHIIRALGVEPDQITMVGDNFEKDIVPCHELGMKTVWITSEANQYVPEGVYKIKNLEELQKLLFA